MTISLHIIRDRPSILFGDANKAVENFKRRVDRSAHPSSVQGSVDETTHTPVDLSHGPLGQATSSLGYRRRAERMSCSALVALLLRSALLIVEPPNFHPSLCVTLVHAVGFKIVAFLVDAETVDSSHPRIVSTFAHGDGQDVSSIRYRMGEGAHGS